MPFLTRPCPICGEVLPVNTHAAHKRKVHGVRYPPKKEEPVSDFPRDAEPETKRPRHPKAEAVEAQFKLIYDLLATAMSSRAPVVSSAMHKQSSACAKADEQLLRRWPKLYEAMEKGLIAGDILAVVMAHMPILAAVRIEMDQRRVEEMIRQGVPSGEEFSAAA